MPPEMLVATEASGCVDDGVNEGDALGVDLSEDI